VDSKAEVLENFIGENTANLRDALKIKSELAYPARTLDLVVAGTDGTEVDLDELQDLKGEDGVFNFKKLVVDYKIEQSNPILVKFPGK